MTTTTTTTTHSAPHATALSVPAKAAIVADTLDCGVDHGIDLCGLVADVEADGFTITADPPDSLVDELFFRAPAFTADDA